MICMIISISKITLSFTFPYVNPFLSAGCIVNVSSNVGLVAVSTSTQKYRSIDMDMELIILIIDY